MTLQLNVTAYILCPLNLMLQPTYYIIQSNVTANLLRPYNPRSQPLYYVLTTLRYSLYITPLKFNVTAYLMSLYLYYTSNIVRYSLTDSAICLTICLLYLNSVNNLFRPFSHGLSNLSHH
jgi:hypothetical protein